MTSFRRLDGLPPYGSMAVSFPADWGTRGHEGLVVEFTLDDGQVWIGNFEPGLGRVSEVVAHPDGTRVLAIAEGDAWSVDPVSRHAELLCHSVDVVWPVDSPSGFIFSLQGLAFCRLGPQGIVWWTRRISLDGFRNVTVSQERVEGEAWWVDDSWSPFSVDLRTGHVTGGSYPEGS